MHPAIQRLEGLAPRIATQIVPGVGAGVPDVVSAVSGAAISVILGVGEDELAIFVAEDKWTIVFEEMHVETPPQL